MNDSADAEIVAKGEFLYTTKFRRCNCTLVCDFGTAARLFSSFRGQSAKARLVENPTWLSPEVISGENYGTASDVYPFGGVYC